MGIKRDNETMARLYTEGVNALMELPAGDVTLDQFLQLFVGKTVKSVLDDASYLRLYMGNKYGFGGAEGSDSDIQELGNKLSNFVNRRVSELYPSPREYELPEFKEANDFDEYQALEKQRHGLFRDLIRAHREGPEARKAVEDKKRVIEDKIRNTQYSKARQKRTQEYEAAVKQYHNTPMTPEDLSNDGSPEYKALEVVYNRVTGGLPARSEYDEGPVVDV